MMMFKILSTAPGLTKHKEDLNLSDKNIFQIFHYENQSNRQ